MQTLTNLLVFTEDSTLFESLVSLLPKNTTATQVFAVPELAIALGDESNRLLVLDVIDVLPETLLDIFNKYADGLVLLVITHSTPTLDIINALLNARPFAFIAYPFSTESVEPTLKHALEFAERRAREAHLKHDLAEANRRLNQRLQELNTLYTVGKSVISSLDAHEVLVRIIDASVNLTQAEEGFILLKEEDKLYLRIAKNMNEQIAQRFYIEASDPIAWQVIRSGRPTMLRRNTKIATGYLVRSLLYVPLFAPGGGPIGVLGVVNLVKDRAFTENHLFALSAIADFAAIALENARLFSDVETEQSRLSTILAHAAEAILVADTDNRLLLWSHKAAEVFAIEADAQGQPVEATIDHETIRELFEQAGGGAPLLHSEVKLENGRTFNAQLSSINHIGRVVVMQDITHLKELDRLKSEFVSTVSHDLRTPLTTIQGYIELLDRAGPLTEMQQEFITKALSSLSHITALISDLLDIGRIEAGYDLEMQPLRIDELAHEVTDAYILSAEREGLTLHAEIADQPLWVHGNARRLRQVIENLISNAIKYNQPDGWIKLRVQPDNDHVIIAVQDNGIGIPVEEQPKIFERFYRVQTPETEDITGTGLGLAIVKSVVEKHKGRVWVESACGEGSTFAFVLSAHDPPEDS